MTDEKVPQVGDELFFIDSVGDIDTETIEEVGEFDDATGRWKVSANGEDFKVRWEPADEHWYDETVDEESGDDTPEG